MITPMRLLVPALLLLAALGSASAVTEATAASGPNGTGGVGVTAPTGVTGPTTPANGQAFGIGEMIVTYTDFSRRVFIPHHGLVPRRLVTLIRYPAAIAGSRVDVLGAPPARAAEPFPLVVFAHGFNITPTPYAALLQAWVRAGYVVAAPIFPLSNAGAPGGANELDLINQPTDMSFVISRLLAADTARQGILSGLIDRGHIAVSGQSDGGSTALAVAYNSHFVDHRIGASMVLSGAMISGLGGYSFPGPSPPMLAVQGTGDVINLPAFTHHFFRRAPQPKFLLSLLGAPHLGPYTNEQPQLGIVERVTIAFLDRYLKPGSGTAAQMQTAGEVPHLATLTGGPFTG